MRRIVRLREPYREWDMNAYPSGKEKKEMSNDHLNINQRSKPVGGFRSDSETRVTKAQLAEIRTAWFHALDTGSEEHLNESDPLTLNLTPTLYDAVRLPFPSCDIQTVSQQMGQRQLSPFAASNLSYRLCRS